MPETRAYKLNELKQPAATEGVFLYYFYDRGKLSSCEVTEYQFDRLVELDTEMYNSDRVEKAHKATCVKADGKSYYKKIDMENDDGTLLDEKQRGMLEDITEQATADKRLSVLPEEDREIYELYYLEEYRKKTMKEKPKPTNFEKIFEEAEKACSRLDMTVEEFIHKRFLPQQYARLEKRYTDFRRKYKNIVVIEEDDPRPIREQIIDIFGEGPVPHFSNPEFRKKK